MTQVNYILYYESFHSKEKVRQTFHRQFMDSLIYEIREVDRLLSGLVSGYFHFVILALDKYEEHHAKFIESIIPHQSDIPLIVIANEYKSDTALIDASPFEEQKIYYLKTEELQDLPGISLRILRDHGYFKRKFERKPSNLSVEIGFEENYKSPVQVKNISTGGIQFHSRIDLTKKDCPYLYHSTFTGKKLHIPIEIIWKKKAGDGRWIYGAKYLNHQSDVA
tara:strand:+ start:1535 stop:2200 length:666 start_codon:yes stop_codon:yes gene_type:complete